MHKLDSITEKIILVILFLLVAGSMMKVGAVLGFVAFLMVPIGFGTILWSERPISEWRGLLILGAGAAIIWLLQSSAAAMYAGLAVLGQIVARSLSAFLYRKTRD